MKVVTLSLDLKNSELIGILRKTCSFVSWRYQRRGDNFTKPPINPHTGGHASVSDPTTWGTFEEALQRIESERLDGLGVVLTQKSEIIAVDIDDCIKDGEITKLFVQEIVAQRETFAQVSPSGSGLRLFCSGKLEKALVDGTQGIEIYPSNRFVTITNNILDGSPRTVNPAPKLMEILWRQIEKGKSERRKSLGHGSSERHKKGKDISFFRHVNETALKYVEVWVPILFPYAKASGDGYRVTSYDLGRDLQEDLSIHRLGIVDFGVADQGDFSEGKRTPIDLVIEYGDEIGLNVIGGDTLQDRSAEHCKTKNVVAAAMWLCSVLDIDAVGATANENEQEAVLAAFNKKYAVVSDGGRTQVIYSDKEIIGNSYRDVMRTTSFLDFEKRYSNRQFAVKTTIERQTRWGTETTEKEIKIKVPKWWLEHPERTQYDGIGFYPGEPPVHLGKLNLWTGFSIEPRPGNWSLMRRHIVEVIASNNIEQADYLLNWCAHLVQKPGVLPEVAVVLKGEKGTGKGTLGNALMKIFGQHALQIASIYHLIGNFNAHLRDTCFLFADEAFWPGDKAGDGTLKRIITEPTLFIEAKGKDGVTVTNNIHLMMASNEEWIIPATGYERRYFVLNVSSERRQDHKWFKDLNEELDNGGLEAMLHGLLQRDISRFNPRQMPQTSALLDQQNSNMDPLQSWLQDILEDGIIPGSTVSQPNWASTEHLVADAKESSLKLKQYLSAKTLAKLLDKFRCKKDRQHNIRGFRFPELTEMRKEWEKTYLGTEWEDPLIKEWQPDISESLHEINQMVRRSNNMSQ